MWSATWRVNGPKCLPLVADHQTCTPIISGTKKVQCHLFVFGSTVLYAKKNVFPKVFLPKEKIMSFSDSVIDSVGPSQHSRHCPQCNLFHSRINAASAFLDLKKVMFTASKGFSAFIACAVTSHSQKNKTHNVIICKFTSKPCAGWISQEWRRLQPKHEYKTLVIRNSILKSLKRLFWEWSSLCWSWMGIPWGQKGRNFFQWIVPNDGWWWWAFSRIGLLPFLCHLKVVSACRHRYKERSA